MNKIRAVFKIVLIFSLLINLGFVTYLTAKHLSYLAPTVKPVINGRYTVQQKLQINSNDVVFIGNSITDHFPVTEMFNNLHIKNRGVAYSNTFELLKRNELILKGKPAKVFIMDGINDITGGITEVATLNNIEKIVKDIKEESPKTKIYLESILPVSDTVLNKKVKAYNVKLNEYCLRENIMFLDLYQSFSGGNRIKPELTSDGIHLTGDGYLLWKRMVDPYVFSN